MNGQWVRLAWVRLLYAGAWAWVLASLIRDNDPLLLGMGAWWLAWAVHYRAKIVSCERERGHGGPHCNSTYWPAASGDERSTEPDAKGSS